MFCAKCGQQIPDSSSACPLCGRDPAIQLQPRSPAPPPAGFDATSEVLASFSLTQPKPKTVGGWLLLFCIVLTILTPLGNLVSLQSSYQNLWGLYYLILITSSMIVGISLWMVNSRALSLLKVYFISLAVWELFRIGYVLATSEPSFDQPMLFRVRTLAWIAIWASYFHKSARVRETFGRNL